MSVIFAGEDGGGIISALPYGADPDRNVEAIECAQGQGWTAVVNGDGTLALTKGAQHHDLQQGDWIARAVVPGGSLTGDIIAISQAEMNTDWRQLG